MNEEHLKVILKNYEICVRSKAKTKGSSEFVETSRKLENM